MISVKIKFREDANKEVFGILIENGKIIRSCKEVRGAWRGSYTTIWVDFETIDEMKSILSECNQMAFNGLVILKQKGMKKNEKVLGR